ncbi:hypothetical protein PG997_014469 [Apiospora hydei]|uniref:Major facilitator superfamily (MFS) profile domain-containing protein n=1 Tax=Apiospora hydei TaxID=1337664 RepID=A0ABR1UTW6_9PEZI
MRLSPFAIQVPNLSVRALVGYDTAVIGGTMALESFIRDFGWSDVDKTTRDTIQGNIVSTFQVGHKTPEGAEAVPVASSGPSSPFPIAEKFGRRIAILCASLVFLLGATLMTASRGSLNLIYGGRAIAGLGIGSSSLVVPVYIAEVAPPSIRGRLTIDKQQQAQWIIPLALQLFPGVCLFFGILLFCPESPRWLARGDDFEGAARILARVRGLPQDHAYIGREMAEIRVQVEERSTLHRSKRDQARKLLQRGVRNRVAIGVALMFLQSFTGVNIITYYAPRIFATLGVQGTSLKLFSTGFYGIAKTLGMFTFTFVVVERVGRRKGLVGRRIGLHPYVAAAAAGAVTRDAWGYLAMVCVYVNGFIICATWQGITWTYASEIFPLDIRMFCVALTTAVTWLGSFIIARFTPYMISDLGYGAYFFFASILISMGIWAFFFVPETKGVMLEQMDALFAKPTVKVVWAQIRGKQVLPEDTVATTGKRYSKEVMVEEIESKGV